MIKFILFFTMWIISFTTVSASEPPIDIRVNGEYIITDSEPMIISGSTYAPVRSISEALNAESVSWDENTKTAIIQLDNNTVKITIGSKTALLNNKSIQLNGEPFIQNNRTFIPVRGLSVLLGADVAWDNMYKNVEIHKNGVTVSKEKIDSSFSHDDLYWMSRIIKAESCGESLAGKIAVGDVILNRKNSNLFPNTVYEVIFDKKYSVQFEPVLNGSIYNTPCEESVTAAKISMTNPSSIGNCLYFFNPSIASSSWIEKNRVFYKKIGNHDFYL